MVWTWEIALHWPSYEKDGERVLRFTEKQRLALEALWICLKIEKANYSRPATAEALDNVLDAIFFPEQVTEVKDVVLSSPLVGYIMLQCLEEDGGYRSIYLIPPVIAKVQYAIRLRAWIIFNKWYQENDGAEDVRTIFK